MEAVEWPQKHQEAFERIGMRPTTGILMFGCFDRLLYVEPQNEIDWEEIFRIHLRKIPCNSDGSIRDLACLTEGCTGADISLIG
ncbi:hypothetical protein Dsin_000660 [Dipteronia sinensis]|uniref:Uncharacterized protein n=1 Tax=Dipteronia sinensis TaxID=43782 RepID=A0AAE0B3V8_9ROSI|nr:hypothetical protein Dsin_000660 [Dipteronia sinensis]